MADINNIQAGEWHNNEINQAIAKQILDDKGFSRLSKMTADPIVGLLEKIDDRLKSSDQPQANLQGYEQLNEKYDLSLKSLSDTVAQAELSKLEIAAVNLILQNETDKISSRAKGLPNTADSPSFISLQEKYIVNQVIEKRQELVDKITTGELQKSVENTAAHFSDNKTNLPYYGQPDHTPF